MVTQDSSNEEEIISSEPEEEEVVVETTSSPSRSQNDSSELMLYGSQKILIRLGLPRYRNLILLDIIQKVLQLGHLRLWLQL